MTPLSTLGVVRVKAGATFTTIAPAGFRILAAIERAARILHLELTVTSACDGAHSGPADPHHRGEAYDVRTHTMTEALKDGTLRVILTELRDDGEAIVAPVPGVPRSLCTA